MNDTIVKQSPAVREILADQLTSLEGVQRFNSNRQVNIYLRDEAARFPNDREELSVARARYRRDGARISVEIVCHRGVLSTLEFSKDPKLFHLETAEIAEVELLADLMTPPPPVAAGAADTVAKLQSLLGGDLVFGEVIGPARPSEIDRFRKQLGTLPDDLKLFLRTSDGWKCKDWKFVGTRARRIPRRDETLVAVAEKGESGEKAVCIAAETARRWILFDEIDDAEELVDEDLSKVLRYVVVGPQEES